MYDETLPVVALIYDFDGTLSPGNMQEFSFIKALNMTSEEFWRRSNELTRNNDANGILCYMKLMLDEAQYRHISLKRESFQRFGREVEFYPGVAEWFSLVNGYGRAKGVAVRHYINSSGLKEMIEGTAIAREFENIYACSFLYDVDGKAVWPAVAVDFTTKTQFLFKINKGISSVSDNSEVNRYMREEERPVPFRRMIYFGDGQTDIPCMKMVRQNGGHSIAVYDPASAEKRRAAERLILEERVLAQQLYFEKLLATSPPVQSRHLHAALPCFVNIGPTMRLVRADSATVSFEGVYQNALRGKFDKEQLTFALRLFFANHPEVPPTDALKPLIASVPREKLLESVVPLDTLTSFVYASHRSVTRRFSRVASISDFYVFRSEFARNYGYSQFIQYLFASLFFPLFHLSARR